MKLNPKKLTVIIDIRKILKESLLIDWLSSLFLSLDLVAVESVGFNYLY